MKIHDEQILIAASDLSKHLACRHLTSLDLQAAQGKIERIHRNDASLDVLIERGFRHENAYLEHLQAKGLTVLADQEDLDEATRIQRTIDAMKAGVDAIVQADLEDGRWRGRADVLRKVATPSALGNWSYEVVDTKLARETRGGTILQLCLYSELLAGIQETLPKHMHVVSPGREFEPESFRTHDFMAYYRLVKSRLEAHIAAAPLPATYPEPVEQCDVCSWWTACNDRRRTDDHLSFVAGISGMQIAQLREWGTPTLAGLAALPLPLKQRPDRGAPETYVKAREQARLQLQRRETGKPVHELLALEGINQGHGLARLPKPSDGDIFLDFEGDPFVEGGGFEYLLGYVGLTDTGDPEYTSLWALDRAGERRMFESFVDAVMERRSRFPDLHVYHFTHYEPSALKRLMGRYATREDEIDQLLRSGVFVDLHSITRQSLRASVEKYSLKDLEAHFGFERKTDLRDARRCLRHLECALELGEPSAVPPEVRDTVGAYNREDCLSAYHLRQWLEGIRRDLRHEGHAIPRPPLEPGDPSEAVDERRRRVLALAGRLLAGIPEAPAKRNKAQKAQWLLAHMLEWHRREEKAPWWEYFRLRGLTDAERIEERSCLSGLEFIGAVESIGRTPVHRYHFPPQDTQIRNGDKLHTSDTDFGEVKAIDYATRTIDIKKRMKAADLHPTSVFAHTTIGAGESAESLYRIGEWVANHGMDIPGSYRAGRDLLLRNPPRMIDGELDYGTLPIQGPPGAGKTYTAARMICTLLKKGKKIGITAVSHKVIRKLLEETLKAAIEEGLPIRCIEKVGEKSKTPNPAIPETMDNKRVLAALQNGEATIAAGTAWLWARPDMAEAVDVLFVDEAGQMSLADVVAVSQGAENLVLLGDPQQLEQPIQGTHPPGLAVSALQHILGEAETMPPELGLFLEETWRLAPAICAFTSELFYGGLLNSHAGLERQKLRGPTRFAGSGLWFVPAVHEGNQSSSKEEVAVIEELVRDLLRPGITWINSKGEEQPLTERDILIVSPYNAQVFDLAAVLPKSIKAGTVDKFQGQEAPVVIYSMATSSPEDAPRGMEFLYSLNRFNVATSRAQCACIVVASPRLLEPECRTPRQMKLANVLCRFFEMAQNPQH